MASKHFASLGAMIEHIEDLPLRVTSRQRDSDTWAGGSMDQAMQWAKYGWPEGASKARELADRIVERALLATGNALQQTINYDTSGAAYDIGALAQGVPEMWSAPTPELSKRALVIGVNVGASCGVPVEVLTRRGIALAALVMLFQSRGYPVTVHVIHGASTGAKEYFTAIDAETGSQVDIDRLVYAVAHPTVLRRLFRAVTNGFRNSDHGWTQWDNSRVHEDVKPEGIVFDMFIGGAHLYNVQRWQDGGDDWVLSEYVKQTG